MKVKIKRSEVVQLQEQIKLGRLKNELRLMEAESAFLDNIVDCRGAYIDDVTNEQWIPISGFSADDRFIVPFRNEMELSIIRQTARIQHWRNPYAKNILNSIVNFVAGTGHKYNCVVADTVDYANKNDAENCVNRTKKFLDRLFKINCWPKRQKEIALRNHRDGETFIRLFPQDNGYTKFRYVEPAFIRTPTGIGDSLEDVTTNFGIRTEDADVETIISYWVHNGINDTNPEEVPACEIQHRKRNADSTQKRGLSSLYCPKDNLEAASRTLRNMASMVDIQSAIGMIRTHENATKGDIVSFATNGSTFSRNDAISGENVRYKKNRPAQVVDAKPGTKYEFPSINVDPSAPVAVVAAECRAVASSHSLPEYMVGSDASNANYASTMVAENPGVKFFESDQADTVEEDLEIIWAAIDHAIDCGILPADVRDYVEIQVNPPKLISRDDYREAQTDQVYTQIGVKSLQTITQGLGLEYDQEQQNRTTHDETYGAMSAMDLSGGSDPSPETASAPIQQRILNGAQIVAATAIVTAVASGTIPRDSGVAQLQILLGLPPNEAIEMMGSAGTDQPTVKNPGVPVAKPVKESRRFKVIRKVS